MGDKGGEIVRFLDLFAGIGGFRLALERAGHKCIGFCEIDKFARQTYKANFDTEGEVEWHDITTVTDDDVRQVGRVDIITGGFPCQAFSVAGRRGGFDDTRGTLFFDIMRIARIAKPEYLLLENVKGLLSHDKGRTFDTILNTMAELGYWWEYQILNSKNFGVPQNRERVFIIGHLGGEPRRKIFPIEGTDGEVIKQIIGGSQGYRVYDPSGTSVTLASQAGGMGAKTGLYAILDTKNPHKGEGVRITEYCPTLGANDYKEPKKVMEPAPVLTPDRAEKRQNGRRFKEPGELMFTLVAQDRHGVLINRGELKIRKDSTSTCLDASYYKGLDQLCDSIRECMNSIVERGGGEGVLEKPPHIPGPEDINNTVRSGGRGSLTAKHNHDTIHDGVRIRRLTPLECFRLQGFPDSHHDNAVKAGVSNSQLYKQAGNAVTVNVVYEIARRLS